MNFTLNTVTFSDIDTSSPGRVVKGALPDTIPSVTGVESGTMEIAHTKGTGTKPDRHMLKFTYNVTPTDGITLPVTAHVVITIPNSSYFDGVNEDYTNAVSATDGLRELIVNVLSDTEYVYFWNFLHGFYEGEPVGP